MENIFHKGVSTKDFPPRCFHQTVLTYIPTATLLFSLPFQIYLSNSSRFFTFEWGQLNLIWFSGICPCHGPCSTSPNLCSAWLSSCCPSQTCSTWCTFTRVEGLLLRWKHDPTQETASKHQVHIVANIIRAATYLLALLVMLNCKRKGEVTSGTLFIYWLVATACGAVTFRWKSHLVTFRQLLFFFWRSLVADPQFFVDLDNLSSLLLLVQVHNHNQYHRYIIT